MDDQQQDETMELDGYPPDPPEDGPGQHVPQPRAHRVKRPLHTQAGKGKVKRGGLKKGSSRILSQQKRRQALELRKAGATYAQIAQSVGYNDASAAHKAVMKAFGEVIQEPVNELKTIQVERLNHMLVVLWPKVQQGDERAIGTALMVMNKIDALMGTEAAQRVTVKNENNILVVDGDKDDYIAALKKMAGAGVGPDGNNISAATVAAQQTGPAALGAGRNYPPGMGGASAAVVVEEELDVVDAVVVEDVAEPEAPRMSDCPSPLGTVCKDPSCALHYPKDQNAPGMQTKKRFSFGVDPTVKRNG